MSTESSLRGFPVGRTGRVLLGLWSLFLLGGFAVAAMLTPDPRGYGTHRGLGLPPCTIRALYDIPCPSCGMTTSFSNFVRGRFVASVRANVAGFVLAVLCALQVPWCWVSLKRGELYGVWRPDVALMWLLLGVTALSLLQWAVRVYLL